MTYGVQFTHILRRDVIAEDMCAFPLQHSCSYAFGSRLFVFLRSEEKVFSTFKINVYNLWPMKNTNRTFKINFEVAQNNTPIQISPMMALKKCRNM